MVTTAAAAAAAGLLELQLRQSAHQEVLLVLELLIVLCSHNDARSVTVSSKRFRPRKKRRTWKIGRQLQGGC